MTSDGYEISCAGFAAQLEAFARERDPDSGGYRLWVVSLVGGVTTVRAIWANLWQGELGTIRRGDEALGWNYRLARHGIAWQTYQVALPSAGAVHLLALPDVAACHGRWLLPSLALQRSSSGRCTWHLSPSSCG